MNLKELKLEEEGKFTTKKRKKERKKDGGKRKGKVAINRNKLRTNLKETDTSREITKKTRQSNWMNRQK